MAVSVVQLNSAGQNTAVSTATMTLGGACTAGNTIMAVLASDAYATTGAPTGFTESTGCRQHTFLGLYFWWKVAAGGETGLTKALSGAGTHAWAIAEIAGLDPASPFDISNGQSVASSAANYTTPAITPTAGDRFIVATAAGSHGSSTFTDMDTWINSFTEFMQAISTATGAHELVASASLSVTASGSTAYSSGSTYQPVSPESRASTIAAFKVAGGAPPAASPVPFISQYSSFH